METKVQKIEDLEQVNGYKPLPKQKEFHERKEKYVLLSGSYGGAKSCSLVNEIIFHMLKYPGARVLLCRQYLVSLKKSTMEELFKWLPRDYIKSYNKAESKLVLKNGSMCFFSGLGDEKTYSRILSTEYSLICVDEISEITDEGAWSILVSRLRYMGVPEEAFKLVASTNPCGVPWIKQKFIDFVDDDYYTVYMNADMNSHLPEHYVEDLRKSLPESQHSALIDGEWGQIVEENALFEMDKVEQTMKRRGYKGDEVIYAVDVGEYGNDDSVISRRSGTKVEIVKRVGKKSLADLSRIVAKTVKDKEVQIIVDALGLGNGLFSMLEEQGYNVFPFKGNERSYLPEMYANRKTESFFELMDRLEEVALPKNSNLRIQMEQTVYTTNNKGLLCVESNRTRKKRGLKSPNELDSISMLFSTDICEDRDPNLLKRMMENLAVLTHKKGEPKSWEGAKPGDVRTIAVGGKPTGRAKRELPKPYTEKEEIGKTEEEIFDRWAESQGYLEYKLIP